MPLEWPVLSMSDVLAIRSQRDFTRNVSIDQFSIPGVNLNAVLLQPLNYTSSVLSNVENIFRWGASRIFVDLYWNWRTNTWQICPFMANSSVNIDFDRNDYGDGNEVFQENGHVYECNSTLTFSRFLEDILLKETIERTDDNLNARLLIVTLNLREARTVELLSAHARGDVVDKRAVEVISASALSRTMAATSTMSSEAPNATQSIIYGATSSLGSYVYEILEQYVYTPPMLRTDRHRVNLTWDDSGSSTNGWPLVENLVFKDLYRVLFSFGEIEVPSNLYDPSGDSDYIFPSSSIPYQGSGVIRYETSSARSVCSVTSNHLVEVNSVSDHPSWLQVYDSSTAPFTEKSMRAYLECGFSPVLNASMETPDAVLSYLTSSLSHGRWSWEPGQPTEQGTSNSGTDGSRDVQRCTTLEPNGWAVRNCYDRYRVACRVKKASYEWRLSARSVSYYDAVGECQGNSMFSLPRTAVQNNVLQTIRNASVGSNPIWIDLNSIAQPNCWVSGGPGAACPYVNSDRQTVEVVVPTVAAVVVAVLLACMFFLFNHAKSYADRIK
ncbi:hypothetical protein V1512DRAFT_203691 [Lipomyces arxii]|uniref:uncharacterized protein n=1 Tax=Lipomyces arxii TaxID=56418 RepID=UPI0034CE5451